MNYELGRFYDSKRPIVCIKNTDIASPPPAFQPYQSYDARPAKLGKFLRELFHEGVFSDKQPINADVGNPGTEFSPGPGGREVPRRTVRRSARQGALLPTPARLLAALQRRGGAGSRQEHRRGQQRRPAPARPERVVVDDLVVAQARGRQARGLARRARVRVAASRDGRLAAGPSPNSSATAEIHLPIVVKAETVDGRPRRLVVIFVSAGIDRLLPLLGWTFPRGMPDDLKYLMQLIRSVQGALGDP